MFKEMVGESSTTRRRVRYSVAGVSTHAKFVMKGNSMMRKLTALMAAIAAFSLLAALFSFSPAAAQDDTTRITLLHGIPDTDVDVSVDGDVIIDDFRFGDRQDLSGLAGQTLVDLQVLLAGTDDVALDQGDITLPEDGNLTAVAHLDPDGSPILTLFVNGTSEIDAGKGRITFRHTAAAEDIDIRIDGSRAINGMTSGKDAGADLPADPIEIEVFPQGSDDSVVGPETVDVVEGESVVVYIVGTDEEYTVLTDKVSLGPADGSGDADADDDAQATADDDDTETQASDDDADAEAAADDDDSDDEDTAMNSAPAGVETGNSPITSTTFPVAALLIGIIVLSMAGTFGLRRRSFLD